MGCHPVAEVQYTFTHKQYIEQYKTTIHTTTQQFWKSAGRAPSWLALPWHLPYNRGKSTEKPQSNANAKYLLVREGAENDHF